MRRGMYLIAIIVALSAVPVMRAAAQCVDLDAPAKDVPSDSQVAATSGAVYLALIGGDTPTPNDCGLIPTNDPAEWMGWGGPLDTDNASMGEGPGTRNFITIGGVRYERGIGTHAEATFTYDLTGGNYTKFSAFVGMDDEKDGGLVAPDCGHGGSASFTFSVDGTVMFDSGPVLGVDNNAQVAPIPVEFDIPAGAKVLTIKIGDGGDGLGCDHADIADAKLIVAGATAVDPTGKTTTTWATLKNM